MATNMAYRRHEEVWVVVHGSTTPSTGEWSAYLAALSPHAARISTERTLLFTAGGGPNAVQRAELSALLKNQKMPAAIVSAAPGTRAIVAAISLLIPGLKQFSPTQIDDAMIYLGIPWGRQASILREAGRLARPIGDASLLAMLPDAVITLP